MPRATYVAVGDFCGMPVFAMLCATWHRIVLIVVGRMSVDRFNLRDEYQEHVNVSMERYKCYLPEYHSRVQAFSTKLQKQEIPKGGGCLEFYTDENAMPVRFQGKMTPDTGWSKQSQVRIWKQADWVLVFSKQAPEFTETHYKEKGRLKIRFSAISDGSYAAPGDKYRVGNLTLKEEWLAQVHPIHDVCRRNQYSGVLGFIEFINEVYKERGGFEAFAEKRVDGMQALEEPWKQAPPESTAVEEAECPELVEWYKRLLASKEMQAYPVRLEFLKSAMSCTKCQTPKILEGIVKATEKEDGSGFDIKNKRDLRAGDMALQVLRYNINEAGGELPEGFKIRY